MSLSVLKEAPQKYYRLRQNIRCPGPLASCSAETSSHSLRCFPTAGCKTSATVAPPLRPPPLPPVAPPPRAAPWPGRCRPRHVTGAAAEHVGRRRPLPGRGLPRVGGTAGRAGLALQWVGREAGGETTGRKSPWLGGAKQACAECGGPRATVNYKQGRKGGVPGPWVPCCGRSVAPGGRGVPRFTQGCWRSAFLRPRGKDSGSNRHFLAIAAHSTTPPFAHSDIPHFLIITFSHLNTHT